LDRAELLIEDLVVEELVFDGVYCFLKSLVLLALLDESCLHLLHRLLPFDQLFLIVLDVSSDLLYLGVLLLHKLVKILRLLLESEGLRCYLGFLAVELADPDLEVGDSALQLVIFAIFLLNRLFQVI